MKPSLQEVGLAVKRLQWRHHRDANRRLADVGLSLVQWDVLRHLREQPEASLHDLAQLTFQTDQSMGELAKRMTSRGLIRRIDGRGRAIRHGLTDDGIRLYENGSAVLTDLMSETIGRLTARERATLHELLLKANSTAGSAGPA